MDKKDYTEKFEANLNLFDKLIQLNDIKGFKENLSLLSSFEKLFLKIHPKRKQEGVFYTDKSITIFIVSELIFLLINEKLQIDAVNQKIIQKVQDLIDLDINNKQKINDLLLHISDLAYWTLLTNASMSMGW